ncbi:MAG TPA: hypothetical protein VEN99_08065 [Acidimicrobiia bacterium]|nr:hypothetical protein [Acidimicrobiia bacterium]
MMNGDGLGQAKSREPVERIIDLFVHTPIGLAVMAWKRVPEMVVSVPELVGQVMAKSCAGIAEAEVRLSEEVRKARMIGQVAVTFGGRQLRREVDARLRDARQAAEGVASFLPGVAAGDGSNGERARPGRAPVSATATPTAPASPAAGAKPAKAPAKSPAKAPAKATRATAKTTRRPSPAAAPAPASAADLPIREYDGLSASQVVSRLTGLSPEELRAVRAYEAGSRGRRTVLLAIDRLL